MENKMNLNCKKNKKIKKTFDALYAYNNLNKESKDIKTMEKKAGYNNYSQRSYSNLSDLYANNIQSTSNDSDAK